MSECRHLGDQFISSTQARILLIDLMPFIQYGKLKPGKARQYLVKLCMWVSVPNRGWVKTCHDGKHHSLFVHTLFLQKQVVVVATNTFSSTLWTRVIPAKGSVPCPPTSCLPSPKTPWSDVIMLSALHSTTLAFGEILSSFFFLPQSSPWRLEYHGWHNDVTSRLRTSHVMSLFGSRISPTSQLAGSGEDPHKSGVPPPPGGNLGTLLAALVDFVRAERRDANTVFMYIKGLVLTCL